MPHADIESLEYAKSIKQWAAGAASYLIAELYMTSDELQDLDYETTRFCTRKPK